MAKIKRKRSPYQDSRVYDAFRSEMSISAGDFTNLNDFLDHVETEIGNATSNVQYYPIERILKEAEADWVSESTTEERIIEGEIELADIEATESTIDHLRGEGQSTVQVSRSSRLSSRSRVSSVSRSGSTPRVESSVSVRARVEVPIESRPVVEVSSGSRADRVVQDISSRVDENATGYRARSVINDIVSRLRKRIGG